MAVVVTEHQASHPEPLRRGGDRRERGQRGQLVAEGLLDEMITEQKRREACRPQRDEPSPSAPWPSGHSRPGVQSEICADTSCSILFAAEHEHDLAGDASLPEQLVGESRLRKRKLLRDERLDLLLSKKVEQGDQILSKQRRSQPFEPTIALRPLPLSTRAPA